MPSCSLLIICSIFFFIKTGSFLFSIKFGFPFYVFQMFVAITKLVLQTKKEQQKRVAEQPTERIRLDSKGGKSKTGKKGCC